MKVTDSETLAATASALLSITVPPVLPLSITTSSLPTGTAASPSSATVAAIGGVIPYTWSVISGKIPTGLKLEQQQRRDHGYADRIFLSNFAVQVVDSETPPVTATAQLSLAIQYPGGGGNPGYVSGNYAFYLNGFNFENGAWTMAGSFVSDGAGASWIQIRWGAQPFNTNISGTYSIATSGLNSRPYKANPGDRYACLRSRLHRQWENDRVRRHDGPGEQGLGARRKADPTAFSRANSLEVMFLE